MSGNFYFFKAKCSNGFTHAISKEQLTYLFKCMLLYVYMCFVLVLSMFDAMLLECVPVTYIGW